MNGANCSEEREEGEIIDDFEDVSDDSTSIVGSPVNSGKSVASPEPVSSICLSNTKYFRTNGQRKRKIMYYEELPKKVCRRKRMLWRQMKCQRRSSAQISRRQSRADYCVNDSDCEELIDPQYVKQLREALKRESTEEALHNSLKTRLKPLIETNSQSEDEMKLQCEPKSENNVLPKETDVDLELQELRLAALKSFVLQNHERRKQKANGKHSNVKSGDVVEIDKENDQCVINNGTDNRQNKEPKIESRKDIDNLQEVANQNLEGSVKSTDVRNSNPNTDAEDFEEDPDIMRAKLLASITQKLTTESVRIEPTLLQTVPASKPTKKLHPRIENVKPARPILPKSIPGLVTKNAQQNMPNTNSNTLSRPSNQIQVKPLIINLNSDSDSETDAKDSSTNIKASVTEFLKKQRAQVEATAKHNLSTNLSKNSLNTSSRNTADSIIDKSAVKLLPQSQQLEYRKLKQLIMARKKMKLKRLSQRILISKKEVAVNNKKSPKLKSSNTMISNKITKNSHSRNELSSLQKSLNDMQVLENGRLQMKGKYRSLTPLMHKICRASDEKLEHEAEIRRLLQEIQKVRAKLVSSHQNFTLLVQQLVNEKNKIDKGEIPILPSCVKKSFVTSTPNKTLNANKNITLKDAGKEQVPQILNYCNKKIVEELVVISTPEAKGVVLENAQQEEIGFVPSDISAIKDSNAELRTFPKYISPLDNRDRVSDPLTVICPYDLLGVCKDGECPYAHCS